MKFLNIWQIIDPYFQQRITLIVKIHGPGIDLPSIDIRKERSEDQIYEKHLHDGLLQIEPNGVDDELQGILLVNLEKEQKQPK